MKSHNPHKAEKKIAVIASAAVIENTKIISPALIIIENGVITKISEHIPKKALSHARILNPHKAENTTRAGAMQKLMPKRVDTPSLVLKDTVLLPGFVNAHCHLELTNLGPLKEKKFVPWIKTLLEKKQGQRKVEVKNAIRTGIRLNLLSGCTTIIDHISFDTPLSYYNDVQVRVIGFGEVVGTRTEMSQFALRKIRDSLTHAPIPFYQTLHSVHAVSPEVLKTVLGKKYKALSLHLAESREECDYFKYRAGPLWLFIAALRPDIHTSPLHAADSAVKFIHHHKHSLHHALVIHANYTDSKDIKIMATWPNICVVHCPGSFDFFGHDSFPFKKYKENKIPIALGTDSIASNSTLNFLQETRLFLKRHPKTNLFEFLPMITTNACHAIGLKKVGMIKEGYRADMVGFKLRGTKEIIDLFTSRDKVDVLIYGGNRHSL
ncbi:MAG: amidohydrolase family protein [Deltaproteobacteria bacterium]|nr:amidohydrolase family protein [Deltaproteobacteria bacterium]